MISEPQEIVSGKNLSAKSSEIDFAIVLSRVISSIENDPAQLRNTVYELARIKLQTELSQREAPINVSEKGDLALALESAIDRVETVYSKHDHLRSLDRLTNSSEVDASEITIEGRKSALIIRPPSPHTTHLPSFSTGVVGDCRKAKPSWHWMRHGMLLILVASNQLCGWVGQSTQVAGRAADDPGSLDLTNFERHQARLLF